MALNTYIRDKAYFRSLRDNGANIDSYNIDNEYVKVIDYLNNDVVPSINAIVDAALGGIQGSAGFYLKNIGDGTTQWAQIDIMINDYSLPFAKLINKPVGSLLVSNGNGEISSISTNNIDFLLVSAANSTPIWQLLKTENIGDREITGADIADNVIAREHLKEDLNVAAALPNNSVLGTNFGYFSITAEKFSPGSISIEKLGLMREIGARDRDKGPSFRLKPRVKESDPGEVKKNHIKNGILTIDKFAPSAIGPQFFNRVQCITRGKIAPNTINDSQLMNKYSGTSSGYENGAISGDKIARMRLSVRKFEVAPHNPCFNSLDFTPEVQAAFAHFGCVGLF